MMENNLKFDNITVHFIGIGGISMSALATLLLYSGVKVSGSDRQNSSILAHLTELGAKIYTGHAASNIPADCKLVVYTSAVPMTNVEMQESIHRGICLMERHLFLRQVANAYDKVIAVAGTHGKTTTTAMLGAILVEAGLNPTIHIGGQCALLGGNLRLGGRTYFLTEACEYQRHFLSLNPDILLILNIDEDHPDYYTGLLDIQSAFCEFSDRIAKNGILVKSSDDFNSEVLSAERVRTFGLYHSADYRGVMLSLGDELAAFDVYEYGERLCQVRSQVYGLHNVRNALAAVTAARALGVTSEAITKGLERFRGVERRFEVVGEFNSATVISDYAHHPEEIKSLLQSAGCCWRKFICVFQPHTYSRTVGLMQSFATSFTGAVAVVVLPVFAARETRVEGVEQELAIGIQCAGVPCQYIKGEDELLDYLSSISGLDSILFIGAGDIDTLARKIGNCGKP